jgi:penicillin-binding protein 1C
VEGADVEFVAELFAGFFAELGDFERSDLVAEGLAGPDDVAVAFWITDILSDSRARELIFGRGGNLDFPFPAAVKTGTSQAYHDNWTIGYTRAVTAGVWVGNFDRQALRSSSGVTGAGPIFHSVMLAAMRRAGDNGERDIVDRPDEPPRGTRRGGDHGAVIAFR